jgi:hypothetical protein
MSENTEPMEVNDQLILISGISTTGKSASLRNIRNQERWLYLNTEAGKRLPFKNSFLTRRIADPYEVVEYFTEAIANREMLDGIIIDSITFLMDMFETQYVINSANTMAGWGQYAQFFKDLLQRLVVQFGKPVIIIAHVKDDLDEKAMEIKTAVPIKGSLKNNGVEAYFSTVVSTKRVSLKELEPYTSATGSMLSVSEEEIDLGFKYVFQTRLTGKTTGERIRSPMGMFTKGQTFMDNDVQVLLDHLHSFYSA